jgi:hypothetical protein
VTSAALERCGSSIGRVELAYHSRAELVSPFANGNDMPVCCALMPMNSCALTRRRCDPRRRCVLDRGEAREVAPTSWLMEGMLELRRQGFFRWGWAREDGVIRSLIAIGRFGQASEEEARTVFAQAVGVKGGILTRCHRDMAGLERQPKKFDGEERMYWRVRGVEGIVSRERLNVLETTLSSRHRRARLASVLKFRAAAGDHDLQTRFFLEEFIKVDMPYYLEDYRDFLQLPTEAQQRALTDRARRHSSRHNVEFYLITDNLIELLAHGIIAVKGLDADSLPVSMTVSTFSIPWVGAEEGLAEPEQEKQELVTPAKTTQVHSSFVIRDGRRKISPPMILYIAGQVEICTKQTRMMESLRHAAKFFNCELSDDGVSERTICRVHGMCGVLAMAHTTAGLIVAGHLEETRTLMCGTALQKTAQEASVEEASADAAASANHVAEPSLAARRPKRKNAGVNKRTPDVGDNREILAKRKCR